MAELRGKGWRVLGYFVWMLGAGIVLDSEAVRLGLWIGGAGALMFSIGVLQSSASRRTGERDREESRDADRA